MRDCVCLVADEVVEAVGRVGVDEDGADPLAGADAELLARVCLGWWKRHSLLADICDHLKRSLYAVVLDFTGLHCLNVVVPREAEHVEAVLAGNGHELAAIRPVDLLPLAVALDILRRLTHLLRLDLNPPDETPSLPVKERDAPLARDTQKRPARQTISLEPDVETARLLGKVLVQLDARSRLADGKVVAVLLGRPDKVQRGAEGLVPPRQARVDDVLAVAA